MKKEWLFQVCVRGDGVVMWYKDTSDIEISKGNPKDGNWIQIDSPDFLKALDIARENPDRFVKVYDKKKQPDIPSNMEIE